MHTTPWRAGWRKSSFSAQANGCVEVDFTSAGVELRDTKHNGTGPLIRFTPDQWNSFLADTIGNRASATEAVRVTTDERAVEYAGRTVLTHWHVEDPATKVALHYTAAEWHAFRRGAEEGEFSPGWALAQVGI